MKILITGSHRYQGPETPIVSALEGSEVTVLVHGNAQGVDKIADRWAKRNGVEVRSYDALWKDWGRAAGPIRNQQMVDREHHHRGCLKRHAVCDGPIELVLAFPDELSKGTWDMVDRVQGLGIPLAVYLLA